MSHFTTAASAWRTLACLALAMLAGTPAAAGAQLPGLPVFQNAFANSGFTVAGNYGRGEELTAYALAGAWAPSSARFQLSAGVGSVSPDVGDSDVAYGGRVSAGVKQFGGGAFGVGGFVGIGAAKDAGLVTALGGISLGYRRGLGGAGISAFVSPYYAHSRQDVAGTSVSAGMVRVGAGIDVSFFQRFGVTVGFETGQEPEAGKPGTRSSVFGLGLSYAFGAGR